MDKNIINSHDKFFKELFSQREKVEEFISKTLPTEITQKLDFKTLEIDKAEYISKNLKTSFSDIVYNCVYGKNTDIKISLLFEHKSYPEAYPHFQLLGYMLNIWQTQHNQKKSFTPIIPIIFYHGVKKWTQKPFEQYFENIDDALKNFIPKFEYRLIDTSTYTDQQIKEHFEDLELQIGLLIMKNIFNEYQILEKITEIFAGINEILQNEQGEQFFETVITYLFYSTELETSKIVEKMRTLSPKAGEKILSTALRLRMEGIKEGKKEGKKEGLKEGEKAVAFSLLKQGVPDEIILKATDLTQEQLDYLKTLDEFKIDSEIDDEIE